MGKITFIPAENQEPAVKEISLSSFKELFDLITNSSEYNHNIWRGEASQKYELIPSALRPTQIDNFYTLAHGCRKEEIKHFDSEYIQVQTELKLLKSFLRIADRRGLTIPKIDTLRTISYVDWDMEQYTSDVWLGQELHEIAGLAQHYGIPTRLLDWSYDFLTSLYFASIGAIKKGVNLDESDNMIIWSLDLLPFEFGTRDPNRSLKLVKPPYFGNPNLNAQSGLFTLWEIKFPRMEDLFKKQGCFTDRTPLDKLISKEYKGKVLTKFKIPVTERFKAIEFLRKLGCDASKLFPGYDGVKRTIEEISMVSKFLTDRLY